MEAIRRWSKEGMKSRAPLPRDGRYTKISDERPGRRASGFARSCHRAMQQYDGFEREIPLWYERYKNR